MQTKTRWAVLSLGCFSRNRYWGEDGGKAYRSALCTSTFVEIDGARLVIDPPVWGAEMAGLLDRRTGLDVEDINYVYVTHFHSDHCVGLASFPNARLLAAPGDAEGLRGFVRASGEKEQWREIFPNPEELARRVEPAGKTIMPGVELIELPGHTMGLAGAVFKAAEGVVAVAGDAVMTADFFRERQGYYNSADFELSAKSIGKLAEVADVVVPGHDNYFICKAADRK